MESLTRKAKFCGGFILHVFQVTRSSRGCGGKVGLEQQGVVAAPRLCIELQCWRGVRVPRSPQGKAGEGVLGLFFLLRK